MKKEKPSIRADLHGKDSSRPLSALLSQVLVAFTVELDNAFERQMAEAGCTAARLSLVVWSNLIRFIPEDGIAVRDLTAHALTEQRRIKHELGCLERWGFILLDADTTHRQATSTSNRRQFHRGLREGWGSGRGIRAASVVTLTSRGHKAREIWPPLIEAVEQRWRRRFGEGAIDQLRNSLNAIIRELDIELPHGLVDVREKTQPFPPRITHDTDHLSLPTLLSQLLLAFAIEFERESTAPLALCANALRVLGKNPVSVGEIPRLTGGSPEASGIGWQLKPYILMGADSAARRGKVVRLTPPGLKARQNYHRLNGEIEKRWEERFGGAALRSIRESLLGLFIRDSRERPLLSAGLVPPPGVVRAGDVAPALGRRSVAAAAKQRRRDLVAQTEAFVSDPAGTLPHYPLWDMNRGFGP